MSESSDDYIPVEELASLLGVTIRQATRYADRIRTIKAGKRILYHRGEVEALAEERRLEGKARDEARDYQPPPKKTDLVPVGDMLEYLRERDARFDQAQQQLLVAARRIGELETLLNQRVLPEDHEELRRRLEAAEGEAKRLREELERKNQPWYRRWFGSELDTPPGQAQPTPEEPSRQDQMPPSDQT